MNDSLDQPIRTRIQKQTMQRRLLDHNDEIDDSREKLAMLCRFGGGMEEDEEITVISSVDIPSMVKHSTDAIQPPLKHPAPYAAPNYRSTDRIANVPPQVTQSVEMIKPPIIWANETAENGGNKVNVIPGGYLSNDDVTSSTMGFRKLSVDDQKPPARPLAQSQSPRPKSTEISRRPSMSIIGITDDTDVSVFIYELGKRFEWTMDEIENDLDILKRNRLRKVKDLKAISSVGWAEIKELLPVVKDIIRTTLGTI
jgi:hypothetical protein